MDQWAGTVVNECAECVRLEEVKRAAKAAGDLSKVTDCVVLLRRHPDHDESSATRETP
ncbi:hypothetical protein OK074_7608 [Actinobacteria bacterium OK074]|nr:hypothetical protein OK074_7608 [Actinobacteria bacterium OK074]